MDHGAFGIPKGYDFVIEVDFDGQLALCEFACAMVLTTRFGGGAAAWFTKEFLFSAKKIA